MKTNRIVRLTVNNFLRVHAVDITPGTDALVLVGGENDQGKSSVLNAIAACLSGKDLPSAPIHKGATKAVILMETEEFIIEKKFSGTGGVQLEVRDKEGARLTSPQSKLDALCSRVTFDPFKFTKLDEKAQLVTLKQVAGLDFTDLDAEYRAKFDSRTVKNREVKTQEGVLSGIQRFAGAPEEEVSMKDLAEELRAAMEQNKKNDEERDALSELNDDCDKIAEDIEAGADKIKSLKEQLEAAEKSVSTLRTALEETKAKRDLQKVAVENLEEADKEAITARMAELEVTNTKVRSNARHKEEQTKLFALQREAEALTKRLEEIEAEKKSKLEDAELPVPGLGFNDEGVTYNDLPFSQASTAIQIRTSFAIARKLNPGLPVMLIREGALLDAKSLEMVRKEAEEHGCQVWIEVVGNREDATVIIEDGEVVARPAEAKKKNAGKPNQAPK